jgi:hypothetical protein
MAEGCESAHVSPENRKRLHFYNTYLADPKVEMPRTTQYRKRLLKKTNNIDANETNVCHELANSDNITLCENIPLDEKNFEEDVLNICGRRISHRQQSSHTFANMAESHSC